jgi:hypothetical protein
VKLSDIFKTWRVTAGQVIAELFGGLIVNGPLTTTGAINQSASQTEPLIVVPYSATPTVDLALGNQFVCTITDGVAFVVAAPLNPPVGVAQVWAITFRNAAGGAHGAGTWNAVFKTVVTVFPAIANGFSRTIWFRWNGVNDVEVGRTAADVAN